MSVSKRARSSSWQGNSRSAPELCCGRPIVAGSYKTPQVPNSQTGAVPNTATQLADPTVALVASWLQQATTRETPGDRRSMKQLHGLVADPDGVLFAMRFVDRVLRSDSDRVAAGQLAAVIATTPLPAFLSPIDRAMLRAGSRLAPLLPRIVMPMARRRMRSLVGHLVAPAEPTKLAAHLRGRRGAGFALNVNLLGEAVLGEREAQRRLDELLALVDQPDVDYVSVKISAVASQLNHWARDDSLERVTDRLRILIDRAVAADPPTFVNLDMEEYHDLELTLQAFMTVLGDPAYASVDAGIVLQAYLPDAFPALQRLTSWANARHGDGGGLVKVRLVKGANLAMESVDAAIHGWEKAPYDSKVETDANYKRCVDWLLHRDRMTGVRLGLASHNLFDVAWTHLLAEARGVSDRVQFEMLQGMAPSHAATVADTTSGLSSMLLYTPAVKSDDFDVAISYLFRRLEENASADNFLRHLFELRPGSVEFNLQASAFRESLALRTDVAVGSRRTQNREAPAEPAYGIGEPFRNEPETDPTLLENQRWIARLAASRPSAVNAATVESVAEVERCLGVARAASLRWAAISTTERQRVLHRVGDQLAQSRGELITTMMHEANKTLAEADGEVAEAIDFARWYGDRAPELDTVFAARFTPFGVVAVVPPWNFPVAIPAGGALASLAAGNSVILKPAPETPRCAEIVAEACWAAGVPPEVLQFVPTQENDAGRALITGVDAVVLTGSAETADLFRSWKPQMRLFAETSGKNALIITPNADIDLAVADLVQSAFGHSGQKCSAASLAILVGEIGDSTRFRRQLIDAVESIEVGPSTDLKTSMGPTIGPPNAALARALDRLDDGERWLVRPRQLDDTGMLWSPGVREGVVAESWFHRTECFGPVLGLMRANDLDEAIEIQNSSDFGLTGGISSLDPAEIDRWIDVVEVGNAYINRHITGAIVQRQPFGGWKRSSVGPGAKAGGPNYLAQLGTWSAAGDEPDDYEQSWREHFSVDHDPTDLFCETNVFRYRPLGRVLVRFGAAAGPRNLDLVRKAALVCGVELIESDASVESNEVLAARLSELGIIRMRVLGTDVSDQVRLAAHAAGVHIADVPVTGSGRLELPHYLREQAVSRTLHRFGNLVGQTD